MHFIRLIIVNVDFIGVITRTTVALEVFFNIKIKNITSRKSFIRALSTELPLLFFE